MISIVIIGTGNVAYHLISSLSKAQNIDIIQVFSRTQKTLDLDFPQEKIVSDFTQLKKADLYIISVTDNAIKDVASQIPFQNQLVVHTSGSSSIDYLNAKNRKGVLYPLQTFSKNKSIDFSEIPICIEAENEKDFKILEEVAKSLSSKIFRIDSNQRKSLHVAAVFVCNFVNHLYELGNQICEENEIPFEILYPLIEETATKIKTLSPKDAQTGPAKRNDTETINLHLNSLTDDNKKEIYKLLTKSIIDNGKKL